MDVCGFDLVGWSRMPRHALVCYTSANRQVAIERLQERVASRVKGSTSPLCCLVASRVKGSTSPLCCLDTVP